MPTSGIRTEHAGIYNHEEIIHNKQALPEFGSHCNRIKTLFAKTISECLRFEGGQHHPLPPDSTDLGFR